MNFQLLRSQLKGELLTDAASLGIYATDASAYQIQPVAVALPADEADVLAIHHFAKQHQIALLPRGSGTSLSGQAVAHAIVLDFTKYMNKVLEINTLECWAKVQPGVMLDQLNGQLKTHRLHFAPDPATSNRATFGGMVANNSSGTKSILYGKTVDNLLEVKVALSDGSVLTFGGTTPEIYEAKCAQPDREGEIYRRFREIVFHNAEEIVARYPKTLRRVQGYNLDEFTGHERWNLAKIICGSEGTLGTILEAKVNLEPLPRHKCLVVVHFNDFLESIRAVQPMLDFQPSAIEIVDKSVLDQARENTSIRPLIWFLEGDPESLQLVEFFGESLDDCLSRAQNMTTALQKLGFGYAFPVFSEEKQMSDVWTVRKMGLGLVLGKKGDRKALSFIEDAAIPIPHLADYMEELLAMCQRYGTEVSAYAHASVGVIHVKPFLDLRVAEDIELYKKISEETFLLVKKYGGSWSSEHGDGLVRSAYLERFFGAKIYEALRQVKELFDPEHRMNPGKIIAAPPIDSHLRYGAKYRDAPLQTFYHYREDGNFHKAVHLCTGVGECRRLSGGTMCPSFRATLDEEHSTRGRANVLRLAMSGQMENGNLAAPEVLDALALCLSCKACKSECPSNVDMARLKSEVLQLRYDAVGVPLRDRFVRDSEAWARRLSGSFAPFVNAVQGAGLFKKILEKAAGLSAKRTLPPYAKESFVAWHRRSTGKWASGSGQSAVAIGEGQKVALFADTYLNYYEPNVGKSALHLLQAAGFEVKVAAVGCCQRPRISHGFLREAKQDGEKTALQLDELIRQGYKIAVCEPSCASALTDDLPDLLEDVELGNRLKNHVFPIENLLSDAFPRGLSPQNGVPKNVFVHGHCHQKALYGTGAMMDILNNMEGLEISTADTGCCGMAGSFGYESEHFELSKKISELVLLPALARLPEEAIVVANGFSCRHQIRDFAGRKTVHWVELFS